MTSYGTSTSKRFDGFFMTVDAPMSPKADKKTRLDIARKLDQELQSSIKYATHAYDHFVNGKHPYKRRINLLVQHADVNDTESKTYWRSEGFTVNGAHITLFTKPNLKDSVRTKISFDFLMSHLTDDSFGELTKNMTDTRPPKDVMKSGIVDENSLLYAIKNKTKI